MSPPQNVLASERFPFLFLQQDHLRPDEEHDCAVFKVQLVGFFAGPDCRRRLFSVAKSPGTRIVPLAGTGGAEKTRKCRKSIMALTLIAVSSGFAFWSGQIEKPGGHCITMVDGRVLSHSDRPRTFSCRRPGLSVRYLRLKL